MRFVMDRRVQLVGPTAPVFHAGWQRQRSYDMSALGGRSVRWAVHASVNAVFSSYSGSVCPMLCCLPQVCRRHLWTHQLRVWHCAPCMHMHARATCSLMGSLKTPDTSTLAMHDAQVKTVVAPGTYACVGAYELQSPTGTHHALVYTLSSRCADSFKNCTATPCLLSLTGALHMALPSHVHQTNTLDPTRTSCWCLARTPCTACRPAEALPAPHAAAHLGRTRRGMRSLRMSYPHPVWPNKCRFSLRNVGPCACSAW